MFPTVTDLQGKISPRPTFGPESPLKLTPSMPPQTQGHGLWLSEGGTSQVDEKKDLQHEIAVVPPNYSYKFADSQLDEAS